MCVISLILYLSNIMLEIIARQKFITKRRKRNISSYHVGEVQNSSQRVEQTEGPREMPTLFCKPGGGVGGGAACEQCFFPKVHLCIVILVHFKSNTSHYSHSPFNLSCLQCFLHFLLSNVYACLGYMQPYLILLCSTENGVFSHRLKVVAIWHQASLLTSFFPTGFAHFLFLCTFW